MIIKAHLEKRRYVSMLARAMEPEATTGVRLSQYAMVHLSPEDRFPMMGKRTAKVVRLLSNWLDYLSSAQSSAPAGGRRFRGASERALL